MNDCCVCTVLPAVPFVPHHRSTDARAISFFFLAAVTNVVAVLEYYWYWYDLPPTPYNNNPTVDMKIFRSAPVHKKEIDSPNDVNVRSVDRSVGSCTHSQVNRRVTTKMTSHKHTHTRKGVTVMQERTRERLISDWRSQVRGSRTRLCENRVFLSISRQTPHPSLSLSLFPPTPETPLRFFFLHSLSHSHSMRNLLHFRRGRITTLRARVILTSRLCRKNTSRQETQQGEGRYLLFSRT